MVKWLMFILVGVYVLANAQPVSREPSFLRDWLPVSIGEYVLDDGSAVGTYLQYNSKPYTMASKSYKKNDAAITMIIFDYNTVPEVIDRATASWTEALNQENDEYSMSVLTVSGYKAWESFTKKTKDAQLYVSINNRYLLHLSGSNQQSSTYLRKVAEGLPYKKLIQ
ncbi:MAG: hypothetical protein KF687_04155 [Cyclobacteriaceae bacterium]|nr:hypothetical protein [Cyclobacteriaceae bacterium]